MILEAFRISGCLTTSRKSKHNKNRRGALVKRVVVEFSTQRIFSGILMHSPLRRVPPTTLSRSPPQKQIYLETSVLPTAILSYKIPRLVDLKTSLSSNRASQLNPTQSLSSKSSQCILIVRKRIYLGSARRRRRQIRSLTSLILEIFDSDHSPSLSQQFNSISVPLVTCSHGRLLPEKFLNYKIINSIKLKVPKYALLELILT